MLSEFTYVLIDEEPGLSPMLDEASYLKLPPAVRAKYGVKEEEESTDFGNEPLLEPSEDLYHEIPEDTLSHRSSQKYTSTEIDDDFCEWGSSRIRGGKVTRNYNEND